MFLFPVCAYGQLTGIEIPPIGYTQVDTAVRFTQTNFDAPQVRGQLNGPLTVRVTEGHLTLADGQGLAFDIGDGQADMEMTIRGQSAAVNRAFDGLLFTPSPGFAGSALISLSGDGIEAAWRISINRPLNVEAARDRILAGVASVHGGVQPGWMVTYGPDAHDIAYFSPGAAAGTMIGAAAWGAGRVIAVPDHQALNMQQYAANSAIFFRNGIAWLGGEGRQVRLITLSAELGAWLEADGYQNVTVTDVNNLALALVDGGVLIPPWLGANVHEETLGIVAAFVRQGGGLFLAEYGVGYQWWWAPSIPDAPGNRLLEEAGIVFTSDSHGQNGVVDLVRAGENMNVDAALRVLSDHQDATPEAREWTQTFMARIGEGLHGDNPILKRLSQATSEAIASVIVTPQSPVETEWDKTLLRLETRILRALPVDEITAHRAAEALYGEVPADAPRIRRIIQIDPDQTRWHSTGLYAAPGEIITVDVPAEILDRGVILRMGGHVDNIARRDRWLRPPEVHWSYALDTLQVRAASPFGGALYIDVGTENRHLAPFEVALGNGVEAPFFVLGQTANQEWVERIRNAPAPYAELVSERLSISLPSNLIRTLDDPNAVMTFWDNVVRFQDEVAAHAHLRYMAERINIDVQISAGYLHAGYPTQGPVVAADELVDLTGLNVGGSWGWFHELGHEAQRRPDKSWGWNNAYTFDNSVEATVNIFTVYAMDMLGLSAQGGWAWTNTRLGVMDRALAGLAQGTYADVGVGFKLAMFLQLRDHFQWPALQNILELYTLDDQHPENEAAERDTWLQRTSQVLGHDMTGFFRDTWGLEVSDAAVDSINHLPQWMPAIGGIEGRYETQPGTPIDFPLRDSAKSHDGVADILQVGEPEHGQLLAEDGVWTYTPPDDFTGVDQFSYAVRSSTGHVVESTVEIRVTTQGIRMERFEDIAGNAIDDLRAHPSFPNQPTQVEILATAEIRNDTGDDYGVRLQCILVPNETGDYRFWIASDDNGELWLSPDAQRDGLALIAHVPDWTNSRQWQKFPEQRSEFVALQAGQPYALEALMKEGGGGDNLAIAWAMNDQDPSIITRESCFLIAPPPPPPEPDAALPEVDAALDAAPPEVDAAPDAAIPDGDAAPPEADAATATPDMMPDAALVERDATQPSGDSTTAPADSSALRPDGTSMASDTSLVHDVSLTQDARSSPMDSARVDTDTGSASEMDLGNQGENVVDTGRTAENTKRSNAASGCACHSSNSAPTGFWLFGLLLFGVRPRKTVRR